MRTAKLSKEISDNLKGKKRNARIHAINQENARERKKLRLIRSYFRNTLCETLTIFLCCLAGLQPQPGWRKFSGPTRRELRGRRG